MQTPLQITFHGMDPSPALEARIRERTDRLERYFDRIVSCRVIVEAPHRHGHQGKLYRIKVLIGLPGGVDLEVDRNRPKDHAHEDPYVALRDAFDAADRRLQDHVRRQRGDIKHHEAPPLAHVARLFEDHGFAVDGDGNEVYFHRNAVVGSFEKLTAGDEVRLVVAHGESAAGPQATTVEPTGRHRQAAG
ncbi:cold-shock DNA-binding protein family [Tistlia consotensis]|uniref:Cold-shock DNA-binding protein family n=1 Tax=Tistlia consotensis USBA 355 TaxID=560819 RepID=A0A1Y6C725_9PROT|nr:HPF/RaiA family ribosome-associated protein [Tistlia consotensis]SMF48567.1 cold-shock DNA-binding protein family [Tistlia consotensis USBA 355]SNR81026.1 cold-shock DNA-binding protein family [Tistlia consotensis]